MAIQGARPINRQVVPYLFVHDAAAAVEWYKQVFGAVELYRSAMPGGSGIFVQLRLGESTIQVADENAAMGFPGPRSLGGTPTLVEMYVDDADSVFKRATDNGATEKCPLFDAFYGDRHGYLADPFGHIWGIATVKETVTPEEIARRIEDMLAKA